MRPRCSAAIRTTTEKSTEIFLRSRWPASLGWSWLKGTRRDDGTTQLSKHGNAAVVAGTSYRGAPDQTKGNERAGRGCGQRRKSWRRMRWSRGLNPQHAEWHGAGVDGKDAIRLKSDGDRTNVPMESRRSPVSSRPRDV